MDYSQSAQFITVSIAYFIMFIGFGIHQERKVKSGTDFANAGRDLPGWAATLSERATDKSP